MDIGSKNSSGKSIIWSSMSGTELDLLLLPLISAEFTCGVEPFSFGLMTLELVWLRCPVLVWVESSSEGFTSDDMEEFGGGRDGGGNMEGGAMGAERLS